MFAVICLKSRTSDDLKSFIRKETALLGAPLWVVTLRKPIAMAIPVFTERKSRGRSLIDIDLNSAGASELTLLPKIGPVLAERILAFRSLHGEFESIEDLQVVHGVGPKIVDVIRGVAVGQPHVFGNHRDEVLAKVLD